MSVQSVLSDRMCPMMLGIPHGVGCKAENDTVTVTAGGGNRFGVYDTRVVVFDYSADMMFTEGYHAAGLLFGAENPNELRNRWSAVHIQPLRNHTIRVFCEATFMNADGLESGYVQVPEEDVTGLVHLRVTVDREAILRVYVGHGDIPTYEKQLHNWCGGYIGMTTYCSTAVFSNIRLIGEPIPALTALHADGVTFDPPLSADCRKYNGVASETTVHADIYAASDFGSVFVNGEKVTECHPARVTLGRYGTDVEVKLTATDVDAVEKGKGGEAFRLRIRREPAPAVYHEPFRPQFHFTAQKDWINDPNGLVYNADTGVYHFYFQYVPGALYHNGQVHWGHAVSTDLIYWTEKDVVLSPDPIGTIWSGSAVVDKENTSGLFDDSQTPNSRIVAVYTHSGYGPEPGEGGGQRVDIAHSPDGGNTMVKYAHNSVIPNYHDMHGIDFRDPKVIWMPETRLWLAVLAGGRAQFFTSPDLIHWTHNHFLHYPDGREIHSECPMLLPMPVDGDKSRIKWVYSGGGVFYVIGDLIFEDGKYDFRAETQAIPFHTGVQYATQNFSNTPDGRFILLSWSVELTEDSLLHYYKNWTGTFSVPELCELKTVNGELRLVTVPIPELDTLHGDTLFRLQNVDVTPDSENVLADVHATLYDLTCEVDARQADGFEIGLRVGDGYITRVQYDSHTNKLTVNGLQSGVQPTGVYTVDVQPNDAGTVTLRILADSGIVDVYANDGTSPMSVLAYTPAEADGMTFSAIGGRADIVSLTVTAMNKII